MNQKKVIIIGGGVAGIVAANQLIDSGYSVTLLEAANNLGGRLSSISDNKSGETIDNGQHLFIGAYHNFINFLKSTDSFNMIIPIPPKIKYHSSEHKFQLDTEFVGIEFAPQVNLLVGLLRVKEFKFIEKFYLFKLLLKIKFNFKFAKFSNTLDFLKANNQSSNLIKIFWEPLILATLNTKTLEASPEMLITVMQKGFLGVPSDSQFFLSKVPYSDLFNGFLEKMKAKNSSINFGESVIDLQFKRKKLTSIKTNKNEYSDFDYCISTLQPRILLKLIKDDLILQNFENLSEFQYSPIISIEFWTDIKLDTNLMNAVISSYIHWIFDKRYENDETIYNFQYRYSITISAADELIEKSNNEIKELFINELISLFSGLKPENILHFKIIKEKFATLKSTSENEKLRLKSKAQLNNLFLAGDWTNTGLPGTIEGASISGVYATNQIKLINQNTI